MHIYIHFMPSKSITFLFLSTSSIMSVSTASTTSISNNPSGCEQYPIHSCASITIDFKSPTDCEQDPDTHDKINKHYSQFQQPFGVRTITLNAWIIVQAFKSINFSSPSDCNPNPDLSQIDMLQSPKFHCARMRSHQYVANSHPCCDPQPLLRFTHSTELKQSNLRPGEPHFSTLVTP